jgi:hypothetical protein
MMTEQPSFHQLVGECAKQSASNAHSDDAQVDRVLKSVCDLRRVGSTSDPSWIQEMDELLTLYRTTQPVQNSEKPAQWKETAITLPAPARFVRANRKKMSTN